MTNNEKTTGTALLFLFSLLAMLPLMFLNGLVLTILWGWFITPLFGLAVPSVPLMVGLALIVSYMTYQVEVTGEDKESEDILLRGLAMGVTRPLWVLGVGYLVHLFV